MLCEPREESSRAEGVTQAVAGHGHGLGERAGGVQRRALRTLPQHPPR